MPKVSVVIPSYNHAAYLEQTVQSVFAQSFTDYEVLVIDDGSSDRSMELLLSYQDRLTVLSKENGGPASAKNMGLRRAVGEYIAFLDSDDLWSPDKLELQVRYLDDHRDVGLVFGDAVAFSENERGDHVETGRLTGAGHRMSFSGLFNVNFIPSCTVMVRSTCIDSVGMFEESRDLLGGDDYELWLRIARRYRLGYIPRILAKYRLHGRNFLGGDVEKGCASHLAVIRKILTRYPELPHEERIDLDAYMRRFYANAGRHLQKHGRYAAARGYFHQGLSLHPVSPRLWVRYAWCVVRARYDAAHS